MKKRVLIVITVLAALSLSACSDIPTTTAPQEDLPTFAGNSTESPVESSAESTSPFEQVNIPSSASESIQEEQPVVESTPAVTPAESTQNQAQQPIAVQEPEQTSQAPISTEPAAPLPAPEQSTAPHTPEPQPETTPEPVQPAFDVSAYVSYAKSYGQSIGLTLDSSAVACWDDPITANASCTYLERDIRDRLDWYLASGFTAFTVWSEDTGGSYLIYIGYA